jgi:hypothetical protein
MANPADSLKMASPGWKALPAGAVVFHPSEHKSLAGDPDIHPNDEDLSLGTPKYWGS